MEERKAVADLLVTEIWTALREITILMTLLREDYKKGGVEMTYEEMNELLKGIKEEAQNFFPKNPEA